MYFKSTILLDSFFHFLPRIQILKKNVEQIPSQTNEKQSPTNCKPTCGNSRFCIQMYANEWLCKELETIASTV